MIIIPIDCYAVCYDCLEYINIGRGKSDPIHIREFVKKHLRKGCDLEYESSLGFQIDSRSGKSKDWNYYKLEEE